MVMHIIRKSAITAAICATMAAHAAALTFESDLVEVHAAADAANVTADFKFRNDGETPTRIVKYDAACSCMNVSISDGKLEYAPGESGAIRAVFSVGNYSGTIDKVVALWLAGDGPDSPAARLTVRIHIPVLVSIEPKTLTWDVGADPAPQSIAIAIDPSMEIRVLGTQSSNDAFTTELITHEDGRRYELVVTPKRTGTPGLGIIRIETDCPVPRHRIQQAFGVIRNPPPAARP